MKHRANVLWAGTQDAYSEHLAMQAVIDAKIASNASYDDNEDDDEKPYLFTQQGDIGVVTIKGPVSNSESPWDALFGKATYGAIRSALIHAAMDPEVKTILLDINSGGGTVSGVLDTANLIRMIDRDIKPVFTYGENALCSAVYWLGVSSREVHVSPLTTVGSIGVIATHMEYSKQLKDDGVGVTVVRAGKHKALVSSLEPLTPEALKQIEEQIDAVYQIFVQHVADCTNVPYAYCDTEMADGREFFGVKAVEAGLATSVTSYDDLIQQLSEKFIDQSNFSMDNPGNTTQGSIMKRALTPEQIIAAAASGVVVTGAAPAAPAVEPSPAPAVEAAAPVVAEVAAVAPQANTDVVAFLQTQLKDSQAALVAAQVDNAQLKAQLQAATEAQVGLVDIAANSLNHMRIALGLSALQNLSANPQTLLAEHKSVSAQFAAEFKAGGVAAVSAEAEAPEAAAPDALAQARLQALNPTK
jgi:signal peptide peptidase SppA